MFFPDKFLRKHISLEKPVPTLNNFIIAPGFCSLCVNIKNNVVVVAHDGIGRYLNSEYLREFK